MSSTTTNPVVSKSAPKRIAVGRRAILAMSGLGAAGIVFGSKVQAVLGNFLGTGLGGVLPGGNRFRIYTVTGSYPYVSNSRYRLKVSGLVDKEVTFTLSDLQSMPSTTLVKDFQCVTGWRVPGVHWEGVRLSDLLDAAGVKTEATSMSFRSYDGLDTESLTLDQARRADVIVAYRMLDAPITTAHGGPVRLYVAPMYGYKSLKWLSEIILTKTVTPGFWEDNGYSTDAWVGASNGLHDKPID